MRFLNIQARYLTMLFVLVCFFPDAGYAISWRITPALSARQTYDNNVFLRDIQDFETRLSPSVELLLEDERYSIKALAAANIYLYARYADYNRINQNYEFSSSYNATERLTVGLDGSLIFDNTFDYYLSDSGIPTSKIGRREITINPNARYAVTERDVISFTVAGTFIDYDSDTYTNSSGVRGGFSWVHAFSEILRGSLNLQTDATSLHSRYDHGERYLGNAMLGVEWDISERLTVSAMGGVIGTQTFFEEAGDSSTVQFGGAAELEYKPTQTTSLTVGLDRGVTQGVRGELISRNRARLNVNWKISERLNAGISCNIYDSISDYRSGVDTTRLSYNISPKLTYYFDEDFFVQVGYSRYETWNYTTDSNKSRDQVYVEFSVANPFGK